MVNRHQIIQLMRQPDLLSVATLSGIGGILDEYPFFQAARVLWIKNLHALEHIRFNNELKLASIHVPDRAKLYLLLQGNETNVIVGLPGMVTKTVSPPDTGEDLTAKSRPETVIVPDNNAATELIPEDNKLQLPTYFKVDTVKPDPGKGEDDIKYAFPRIDDNMVLPSADLLDYERSTPGYAGLVYNLDEASDDEYRSFSAWLNLLRLKPGQEHVGQEPGDRVIPKTIKDNLIESFLKQGARIKARMPASSDKPGEFEDFSIKSTRESDDLMTETLANIFIQQKHFSKALEIFERLGLKYPEKRIYFASRIKELEEQIYNQ